MGPNTPEQNPPEKSQAQQAQEAADRAIAQIRGNYQAKFAEINNIQDEGEKVRARAALAQEAKVSLEKIRQEVIKEAAPGATEKPEDIKERADNAKKVFLEVKYLCDNDVNVVDKKSQFLVDKIVEKIKSGEITDQGALAIENNIGKQLMEGVVFSKPDEQLSSFEAGLKNLFETNRQAADPILRNLFANPETYGTTAENLAKKINPTEQESEQPQTHDQLRRRAMEESRFGGEDQYYLSRFTEEQLDLISTFYSPDRFVDYLERLSNGDDDNKAFETKEAVADQKKEIERQIKERYKKVHEPLSDKDLNEQVEKHWGEKVSERMNEKVSEVINQLFLELQQKSPNKFYEEIMQEDIFQGPGMIQKRIQSAVNSLMTKIGQIEINKDDPLNSRLEKLQLYRHAADKPYIDERDGKKYPRLKPLPYGEKISTSDFIQYLNTTIDHTIHKAEYFHNSRAIYGHPAGEKGFYNQLGGFAEALRGTDIDEIMLLPDGQYIMQAYQLYEKYLEEDFASLDWRHRPDQFQNQLERVNSKLEIEIFEQLRDFYPELTKERVRNIVNSAVGISRGMFLTEAEKSAYADPVDADGKGMVASYSTNDAASLNVFNPLHNALRWQGEHNWNMMYFMPVGGQPGKAWDHKNAWNNMAQYMDSFVAGHGRKGELPELFADAMMDINNVGGPNKRKGWRMNYSFDGHYVWDPDNTINAPETFKAMEAIGYEGIAHLINSDEMWSKMLEATEKTNPAQAKERKDLFRYIYKRYFCEDQNKFQESDLDSYLAKLRIQGEKNTLEKIKKNKGTTSYGEESIIKGSWEEQVAYETSKLFLKNTLAHYVAARMPTKFLRIDRNRFTENGVSRWERIQKELNKDKGWDITDFDLVMKDLTMTEMLFRREISEQIREQMSFNQDWTLNKIDEINNLPHRLNEETIRKLLAKDSREKNVFKSEDEIQRVVDLWKHINNDYNKEQFLDDKGATKIIDYKFTFGLEDTDISLIPYRGTGPRMIARAIKDTGSIEATVTPWLLKMPDVLSEIAVSGKHDFTPIIEYLRAAKKAINDVHGSEGAQEFVYKVAGTVINYFKKDAMAKPLFGLFRLGQRNSIAAEYAGRSSAVWEWDSRDIDRFCVALESYRLLPLNPYDSNKTKRAEFKDGKLVKEAKFIGGDLEDRWIKLPFLKNPIRFGKKRHVDFKYNGAKLRKEHGADWKAISWDMVNQFLPLAMAFLLWKYIKDAMDEASGKKKQ